MSSRTIQIVVLITVFAAAATAQQAVIHVNDQATVGRPSFTLGDIARVEAGDSSLAAAVRSVRLGVSPMPGNWRELDREYISSQLSRNGFYGNKVKLLSPALVRIYRESQSVSQVMMESRLREYISQNAPWGADEMVITEISYAGDIIIPAGTLAVDIRPRGSGSYLGRTPFVVDLIVGGQVERQLVMQAKIAVYREAVIAVNAVRARAIIDQTDLEIRRVDIASVSGTAFSVIDDVAGMSTTTYLQPGQIITSKDITPPIIIKRGQMVSLEAVRPCFTIRTTGVAQKDGRKGEIIPVLNPSSRKTVKAKAVAEGRAEVIF
jgi:flagella basal body P-ring formation protein FlgA